MRIQTILNRVEKFKSFTYGDARFEGQAGGPALVVQVLPRKNSLPYQPVEELAVFGGWPSRRGSQQHDV